MSTIQEEEQEGRRKEMKCDGCLHKKDCRFDWDLVACKSFNRKEGEK